MIELGRGKDAPFAFWTGQHYVVLWTEIAPAPATGGFEQNIRAARITASGEVLDATLCTIVVAPQFSAGYAHVVATPAGLVMIFLHSQPAFIRYLKYDVFVARISTDGDLTVGAIQITNTPESESAVEAAVDPAGNIFLTWLAVPAVPSDYHSPTRASGAVLATDLSLVRRFDFGTTRNRRDVAWTGTSFLVSWLADELYVQRYSRNGQVVSDPIALTAGAAPKGLQRIVSAPGGAFIAYTRTLPKSSGSDAQRLVARMVYDTDGRRRAVTPR